jgi:CheY-like chemotaxis protein
MSSDSPRLLVVDDDPASVDLIIAHLEEFAYEFTTAFDGEHAWHILCQQPADTFDCILLDRNMPRMDGIELLNRIKQDPSLAMIPVILQTALNDREEILEGIHAGAFYYLTKPLQREMLVSITKAAVDDRAMYRALQRQLREDARMLAMMTSGIFEYQTIEEATHLGTFLAKASPDPERVVIGLTELLFNAVEHGNLEISYAEKSALGDHRSLVAEVERRLQLPKLADRRARVRFQRGSDAIQIAIEDEGPGFDPTPYLSIDPQRVFDTHGRGIALARLMSFDALTYEDGGRRAVATVQLSR